MGKSTLDDIEIRTDLRPGDLGYVVYMHGVMYGREHHYGLPFEAYVAEGMAEFYHQYDPSKNRVWVCSHGNTIIGFMLLMNRGDAAQLRYFLIAPVYRGIGLGNKMMGLYMEFLKACGYKSSYLLTTDGLPIAARLYRKYGFKLTSEVETDTYGVPVKEQRYEWWAGGS